LQRENVALQALLEEQQRQNELLKQSLQRHEPPQSSLQAAVTVSQMTSFSPTVIAVGHSRQPEPVASTTHRAASAAVVSHAQPAGQRLLVAADVVSSDGARTRRRSPSADRLSRTERSSQRASDAVETVNEPAVQVVV